MKNAFSGWRYLWTSQDIRRKLLHNPGSFGYLPSGGQCSCAGY
jgi:hypothetical protein